MPAPNPLRRVSDFLRTESAGGIALIGATLVALLWANVAPGTYHDVWTTRLALPGPTHSLTLAEWVNEGLMAVFFFVVGLEIKREIVDGELRDPRVAAVPIAAALGGMAVPAAVFAVVTLGTGSVRGWGVPMATDIAFALAVYRVAGRHTPRGLGLMLLTLAVVDDLGAIVVIALFYSASISVGWLAASIPVIALLLLMRRRVEHPAWYIVPALVLWVVVTRSGIHATVAGVALGFLTPVRTPSGRPVLGELEHRVHPWSSGMVLPLFALANAGILITASRVSDAARSPLALGIVLGLVIGKVVGISGGSWIAIRLGARPAPGIGMREVFAVGLLGGIGFTVSLFVANLAYAGNDLNTAKLAILGASVAAAIAASLLLRTIPNDSGDQT